MPGIIMHHHFGHAVFSGLNDDIKNVIENEDLFDLGLAGPDIFDKIKYFNKKQNLNYKTMAYVFHTQDTKRYFLTLIEEVKKNRELFGYLCGEIAHYYLDSLTNPYLYYHTGHYDPFVYNSLKYRGLKEKLQNEIDTYCIVNYYGETPTKFKIYKEVFKIKKLEPHLEMSFNNIYYDSYGLRDGFKNVNLAIKHSRRFYKMIYDPLGIKSRFFEFLDNGKSETVYTHLTFKKKNIDIKRNDIFNMNSKIWVNPIDDSAKSNLSFFDLFDTAKVATTKCITDIYKLIYEDSDINLDYYFNDTSYYTGKPCNLKCNMTYFANNI